MKPDITRISYTFSNSNTSKDRVDKFIKELNSISSDIQIYSNMISKNVATLFIEIHAEGFKEFKNEFKTLSVSFNDIIRSNSIIENVWKDGWHVRTYTIDSNDNEATILSGIRKDIDESKCYIHGIQMLNKSSINVVYIDRDVLIDLVPLIENYIDSTETLSKEVIMLELAFAKLMSKYDFEINKDIMYVLRFGLFTDKDVNDEFIKELVDKCHDLAMYYGHENDARLAYYSNMTKEGLAYLDNQNKSVLYTKVPTLEDRLLIYIKHEHNIVKIKQNLSSLGMRLYDSDADKYSKSLLTEFQKSISEDKDFAQNVLNKIMDIMPPSLFTKKNIIGTLKKYL